MLEELLKGLTIALTENTAATRDLIASRESAVAQLTAEPATTRKPRGKTADAPPPAETAPPATTQTETSPAAAVETPTKAPEITQTEKKVVTAVEVKANIGAWIGATQDPAIRETRMRMLVEMLGHFGVQQVTQLSDEQAEQAQFYTERMKAGLLVDFSADYDFDGPIDQGSAAAVVDPLA